MKKAFLILLFLLPFICIIYCCKQQRANPERLIAETLLNQVDSFNSDCARLLNESGTGNEKELHDQFLKARVAYKKFEWAAEYFEPSASRSVNGPPVQEVERSGQVFEPSGLQVLENLLFPVYDTSKSKELVQQVKILQAGCNRFKTRFANIDILDWQVFDAAKLEVFRVITLGITGFDDPLTLACIRESAASLESLQSVMQCYKRKENTEKLMRVFANACRYLRTNLDFNSFDRMKFILTYGNPLSISIADLQEELRINIVRYNRLLNQGAKTMFDNNAFNVNAYAPKISDSMTTEKTALGKILFLDPTLSGNGKRSCASCHQPGKAFSDGMAKNKVIDDTVFLDRNTPTLINAALQPSLFYDLRVNTLEDQSVAVVQNNNEMHGSMVVSVKRLWNDPKYHQLFTAAFPRKDKNSIDTFEVMNALGSYVRSLTELNSRFDEYMRGNNNTLSSSEINGFNLFMGKAKCGTCHYMPLFNGVSPPRYVKTEAEVIGVPQSKANKVIDPDPGRYDIIKIESLRHSFKTPSIRNISKTAPYMHNGIYNTLEEVMEFYEKGGGAGLGLKLNNQTLPFDKLTLTASERVDIIAFMKSLDSK